MKSDEEGDAQAAKKTREFPKLSECHSCHLRVDIATASAKSKLQILYSEWRIVLLCNKCFSRVQSSELCSYCFSSASSSQQDSFSCRQCNRRVHRHCDSHYRNAALCSHSCLPVEVSVCADCWVPESLTKWRGVVSCMKPRRNGKRRLGLGLEKSRVSAAAEKLFSPNLSVCGCDSSADGGCVKLEIEEDDDDEPLKEGEGSCSNGVDLESVDECGCITTPKEEQRRNAKLDPFYFKYRKRSTTVDRFVFTYQRRRKPEALNLNAFSMLTYERKKPKTSLYACYRFTYKRRRPTILHAPSTASSRDQ